MGSIKEKIKMEVEKIPEDRIAELYNIIHSFRISIAGKRGETKGSHDTALEFFGIWKDMSPEEMRVLEEIQSRRKRTFRERILLRVQVCNLNP